MPKKKLEKKPVSQSVTVETQEKKQRFYCCKCGSAFSRQKGFFPVSHSPMYRGSGYLPICNECIERMYEDYRRKFQDDREALKRICMKMDLYWNDTIYKMVEKTVGVNSRVRSYIGKTNLQRYMDKTFDDTVEEDAQWFLSQTEESLSEKRQREREEREKEREKEAIVVPPELIEFWGKGLDPEFYEELERRYRTWTNGIDELDPGEIALYKQICILEETINQDLAAGKSIDKSVNALNNLLGSANVKPSQKKDDTEASYEKDPFGVWIRRWENDYPVPEPDPDFKDKDGVVRYIETWLKGHICKLVGKTNIYSKMYEEEIEKIRVAHPEFEDEDDETVFNEAYGIKDEDDTGRDKA